MFDYPSPEGQTKTKVKQLTGAVNYIVWDCWYPLVFSDIGATLAHESWFLQFFPFIICLNTCASVIFGVWLAQTHTRHYFSFWRERSVVRLWFYVLFCSPTIMIIMIFMLIFIIVLILIYHPQHPPPPHHHHPDHRQLRCLLVFQFVWGSMPWRTSLWPEVVLLRQQKIIKIHKSPNNLK